MTQTIVFISYKSEEFDYAEFIRDNLVSWGHDYWIDVEHIREGQLWQDAIHDGLKRSEVVCAIFTPASMASKECRKEWYWADERKRFVYPLLFEPIPKDDIPPAVNYQYIDFVKDREAGLTRLNRILNSETKLPPDQINRQWRQATATYQNPYMHERNALIATVTNNWIEGILRSATGDHTLNLGLRSRPELILTNKAFGHYTLPSSVRLSTVFDELGGELLILGNPGVGKTITMLQLAEALLEEAQKEGSHPVPIIFNLTAWRGIKRVFLPNFVEAVVDGQIRNPIRMANLLRDENIRNPIWDDRPYSLQEWLTDAFKQQYNTEKDVLQSWLKAQQLILMLDGLDEVKEEERNRLVDAINEFRLLYPNIGIVVCSRTEEYSRLKRFRMDNAIEIQELTDEKIDTLLQAMHIKSTPALRSTVETPFMLNMLFQVRDNFDAEVCITLSEEEIKRHLLDTYIHQQTETSLESPYTQAQLTKSIGWLAANMRDKSLSVFSVREINVDWLIDEVFIKEKKHMKKSVENYQAGGMVGGYLAGFIAIQVLFAGAPATIIIAIVAVLALFIGSLGGAAITVLALHIVLNKFFHERTLGKLAEHDLFPKDHESFLAECVERRILRKAGDNYLFIHRNLLEHMAEAYLPLSEVEGANQV